MFDLKEFREINQLTQKDLASYFKVTQAYISQIERGLLELPNSYISKIKADGLYEIPLSSDQVQKEKDSSLMSLVESQQKTIESLTQIIKNLTSK